MQSAPAPTSARPPWQVARANAAHCGLERRCSFVACDIASGVQGPFDLVVSNPPYIAHGEIASLAPEVRDYDPTVALDGGDDGLAAYRAIAAEATRLLAPGGRLFVELGAGQESAVRALFTNAGLTRRRCAQGFGRNPARARRRFSAMNMSHSHLMKIAELIYQRKKHLDYGSETTSFRSRNRPVTVASP